MNKLFAATLLAIALPSAAMAAEPSGIFPVPQSETIGATAFATEGAAYRINKADGFNDAAVNALQRQLNIADNGSVEIALTMDETIAGHPQAYTIKVEGNKVEITGRDYLGCYYGVQSFLQLAAQDTMPAIEVTDWPDMPTRGVIEGYYGNPWSQEDMIDMCSFFDFNKMNTFIYGPKNDPYHHGGQVFTPYPDEQAANLKALVDEANAHCVDIVWAMHPGNSNDGENLQKAKDKLEAMYALGFRRFAVFFDDISANSVQKQADFLNYLNREVVKAHDDVKGLIMCPSEYCISFAGGWNTQSTYLEDLGKALDPDIDIMWTGSVVVDMQLEPSVDWFVGKTGRQPFIWHNYPCSDYGSRPLLLCPYEPATTTLHNKINGFTANPMEYYEASKVGLCGMADFAWNAEAYDPWQSWEKAVAYTMPEAVDAFRTYCLSNFNYPSPKSHGTPIIYQETPDFKTLLDTKPFGSETSGDYAAYFQKQLDAATALQSLTDNRLVAELAEWLKYYELQSRRGVALGEMLQALDSDNTDAFLVTYADYDAWTKEGDALISRKGWPVRELSPYCGSQYVMSFISNNAENLVERFKATGAEYPEGLFPERILPTGNYHIVYAGKLLTNKNGSTYPTFVKDPDMVNPNRQVWNIKYIPEVDRYSITSAEDGKYINELGNIGTNEFSQDWNTYELSCLGGLWAVRNGGSAGKNYWQATKTRVQKGENNDWNVDNFQLLIIPAGEEIPEAPAAPFAEDTYVITNAEGQILTSQSDNSLKFAAPGTKVKSAQKWKLTVDPETSRIKMAQGTKYVNEKCVIGTNAYSAVWNTYKLFSNADGLYAIQNGGEGGNDFWTVNDGGALERKGVKLLDAFCFRLTPMSEFESSIDDVAVIPSDTIYDLQGRPVANTSRGLYIQGHKVVRK